MSFDPSSGAEWARFVNEFMVELNVQYFESEESRLQLAIAALAAAIPAGTAATQAEPARTSNQVSSSGPSSSRTPA